MNVELASSNLIGLAQLVMTALIVYAGLPIAQGYFARRRVRFDDDYDLVERRADTWVTVVYRVTTLVASLVCCTLTVFYVAIAPMEDPEDWVFYTAALSAAFALASMVTQIVQMAASPMFRPVQDRREPGSGESGEDAEGERASY